MEQISSKHKADTSGEEHERSRSETSSPGLSATSATADLFDSDPTSRSMKPVPDTNSADQNSPCNTLYVGNLPGETSEDELKTIFARQRGYKRMSFRTKPQGPMCFVEFEDTQYATKALTELHGRALSNSTKGGVRLSFSKNPLGVRSQPSTGTDSPSASRDAVPGPAQFLAEERSL